MRQFIRTCVVFLCLGCAVASGQAQTIGIYFDTAGTQPSLVDTSMTFPKMVSAYVIAKGYEPTDGIRGWELSVSWSDSLFVSLSRIEGQSINLGAYPEFKVGLAQALGTGASSVVLAKLSIVADGPGDVFLGAHSIPSIPASELPACYTGGSLWPLNFEYGGIGVPCASIGRQQAVTANSMGIALDSQFSAMEYQDGEMLGMVEGNKSWIPLPKFAVNGLGGLTLEQLNLISLAPRLHAPQQKTADKSEVLFSESFESYDANAGAPFSPIFNFLTTNISDPDGQDRRMVWGVTDARAASGSNSAYCCAISKTCSDWQSETGCATTYNSLHVYEPEFENNVLFDLPPASGNKRRLSFKIWSDVVEGADWLLVFARVDQNGAQYDYPIGSIDFNQQWGAVAIPIPDGIPASSQLGFAFYSDAASDSSQQHLGIYVDDIKISAFDNDLVIVSATASYSENLSTPNVVTLGISNLGTQSSGSFSVGYLRGESPSGAQVEANQVIPSILAGATTHVEFVVPFVQLSTSQDGIIDQTVWFELDTGDEIPENDETNNISSVNVRWTVGTLTGPAEVDNCRIGIDPRTELYYWPTVRDPWDIAVSDAGVVYVTDPLLDRVVMYDLKGEVLGSWGTFGTGPGEFDDPTWLAVASDGTVYVNDAQSRVQVFDASGVYLRQVQGTIGSADGHTGPIAVDAAGYVYVSEHADQPQLAGFQNRIQKFNPGGGSSAGVFAQSLPITVPITCGAWFECWDLAVASDGSVYLLDAGFPGQLPHKISRYSAGGVCQGIWGQDGILPGQFENPERLAVNRDGNVFVTDGQRVQEFDPNVTFVKQFAAIAGMGIDFYGESSEFCLVANWIGPFFAGTISVYGPQPLALGVLDSHWLDDNYELQCTNLALLSDCGANNAPMVGVTADGVSLVLLRADLPTPGSVRISVSDPNAETTDGLGTLSSLCGLPTPDAVTISSGSVGGRHVGLAVYTGPENFDRSLALLTDMGLTQRPASLKFEFYPEEEQVSSSAHCEMTIHRPPVGFVHGLWDRATGWDSYQRDDAELSEWRTAFVNYGESNGDYFLANRERVSAQFAGLLSLYNSRDKIATAQIDVIAHSMGGILARKIYDDPSYSSAGNLGAGMYNKLLFMNVPHYGSPLANAAVGLRYLMDHGVINAKLTAFSALEIVALMRRTKLEQVIGGAIDDLSIGSPELSFALMQLPIHAHVGVGGSELIPAIAAAADPVAGIHYLLSRAISAPEMMEYSGLQHDLVVGLDSQIGSLSGADVITTSHFIPGTHLKAQDADVTGELVHDFLHTSTTDSYFFATGIPGTIAKSAAIAASMVEMTDVPLFAGDVIDLALSPAVVVPGETVSCSVAPKTGYYIDEAYVCHPGGMVLMEGPTFTGTFDIPIDAIGNYPVACLARLTNGSLARGPQLNLVMNLGAAFVEDISMEPKRVHFVGIGHVISPQVMGQFSDGVVRDLMEGEYWTELYSDNPAVARVTDHGAVQAVGVGEAILTARCHEPGRFVISAQIPVTVSQGPQSNNPPHADAGGPYLYCANRELCLDGSSSYDDDTALGDQLSYSWDLNGDGTFGDIAGSEPCMTYSSSYDRALIGLRVEDSGGRTSIDYAEVSPVSAGCHDGIPMCVADAAGTVFGPLARCFDVAQSSDGGFYMLCDPSTAVNGDTVVLKYDGDCNYQFTFALGYMPHAIDSDASGNLQILHATMNGGEELVRYTSTGELLPPIILESQLGWLGGDPRTGADASGNLYVMGTMWEVETPEWQDILVNKHAPDGHLIETVNLDQLLGNEQAYSFAVTAGGDLYVYTEDGRLAYIHKTNGQYVLGAVWSVEGSGIGQFEWANDIAASTAGDLFVATNFHSVQRFSNTGEYLGQRTSSGSASPYDTFVATHAVAVNDQMEIFVASDSFLPSVQKFRFDPDVSGVPGEPAQDPEVAGGEAAIALLACGPGVSGGQMAIRFVANRAVPPARLSIYDVRGRLVRAIDVGPIETGLHELGWDTRDDRGANVASGVYLLRLQSGDLVAAGKAILIR